MPTPSTRTPLRIARGTYANLNGSVADIQEGEICYATDQDKLYVKEGGTLVATGAIANNAVLNTAQTFTAAQTFNAGASDSNGNFRSVPQNTQTSAYTLVAGDVGKHVSITTGGVTIPSGVFSAGDAISIYNNSGSDQTITQGASVTLRLAGDGTTGNKTLATYGLCTVLCVASDEFVIAGTGLS